MIRKFSQIIWFFFLKKANFSPGRVTTRLRPVDGFSGMRTHTNTHTHTRAKARQQKDLRERYIYHLILFVCVCFKVWVAGGPLFWTARHWSARLPRATLPPCDWPVCVSLASCLMIDNLRLAAMVFLFYYSNEVTSFRRSATANWIIRTFDCRLFFKFFF